jgi:hypothetical protein
VAGNRSKLEIEPNRRTRDHIAQALSQQTKSRRAPISRPPLVMEELWHPSGYLGALLPLVATTRRSRDTDTGSGRAHVTASQDQAEPSTVA